MLKAKIVLVPWSHDISIRDQAKVVKFLRRIPKNSFIALEITPRRLGDYIRKMGKTRKASPPIHPSIHPFDAAWLEVILECEKRNVKIVPLESEASIRLMSKYRGSAIPPYHSLGEIRHSMRREQTMAENIVAALPRKRIKRLFVLTGTYHTEGVAFELRRMSYSPRIVTGIFGNPARLKEYFKIVRASKNAIRAGNEEKAIEMDNGLGKFGNFPSRKAFERAAERNSHINDPEVLSAKFIMGRILARRRKQAQRLQGRQQARRPR